MLLMPDHRGDWRWICDAATGCKSERKFCGSQDADRPPRGWSILDADARPITHLCTVHTRQRATRAVTGKGGSGA